MKATPHKRHGSPQPGMQPDSAAPQDAQKHWTPHQDTPNQDCSNQAAIPPGGYGYDAGMGDMHAQAAHKHGYGMHHPPGMGQPAAAPGMQGAWAASQGYAPASGYVPCPGYCAASTQGWQGAQPGYAMPPPAAAQFAAAGAPGGLAAAMNDIADKSGLGMFKDFLNLDDGEFWKGALVGAAVVLLMTNEDLRNSMIGGVAKTAEAVKSGLAGVAGKAGAKAEDGDGENAVEMNDEESTQ